MKRIECEMCGSTDLVKKDGIFECQSCGLKYSAEEIKKMMIEGTVDVSGSTVKVDKTGSLKNMLVLAKRAKKEGNTEEAKKYYNMVLMEDPDNWEASFYSSYYNLLESSVANLTNNLLSFGKRTKTSLELIINDSENFTSSISEYVNSVIDLYCTVANHIVNKREEIRSIQSDAVLEKAIKTLTLGRSSNPYVTYQEESLEESNKQRYEQARAEMNVNMAYMRKCLADIYTVVSLADIYSVLAEETKDENGKSLLYKIIECWDVLYLADADEMFHMKPEFYVDYVDSLFEFNDFIAKNHPEYKSTTVEDLIRKVNNHKESTQKYGVDLSPAAEYVLNFVNDRVIIKKKQDYDAYWAEHAEEKLTLEKEQKELEEKLTTLDAELKNLKTDLGITDLMNRLSELHNRKEGLGLFKGKEKKEIQVQIDCVEKELVPKNMQLKEKEYAIKSEKNNITRKLEKVVNELTRDR